jgi:hypothetical protein
VPTPVEHIATRRRKEATKSSRTSASRTPQGSDEILTRQRKLDAALPEDGFASNRCCVEPPYPIGSPHD